jgi:hypothetical protein
MRRRDFIRAIAYASPGLGITHTGIAGAVRAVKFAVVQLPRG